MPLTLSQFTKTIFTVALGVSFLLPQSTVWANKPAINADNWLVLSVNNNETVHLVKDSFQPTDDKRYTMVGKKIYNTTQSHNDIYYNEIAFDEEVDCKRKRMRAIQMAIKHDGNVVKRVNNRHWQPIDTNVAWKKDVMLGACQRFYPDSN